MMSNRLFTSESVSEGHPDKVCDQISDAILDGYLAQDKAARVAAEVLVATDLVVVAGEIRATKAAREAVNVEKIARAVIRDIGYDDPKLGFDHETCEVTVRVTRQSADIERGVDLESGEIGAGDQGLMFGFACDETPELVPAPVFYAHRLMRRLAEVRKQRELPWLRPDGKGQVTVRYADGLPIEVDTVLVSAQHDANITDEMIVEAIEEEVIKKAVPRELLKENTRILVNPTGRFVTGGPHGDTGLTGRKIIVDTYGGAGRHGGGAFSGKDPTKVDRSGAYAARHVAKNIVAAGIARRCEVQVAYAIGVPEPVSIDIETFGTLSTVVDAAQVVAAARELFPLTPRAIIERFGLDRPIYRPTAAYGHFGRPELPWEETDRADELRAACGLGRCSE